MNGGQGGNAAGLVDPNLAGAPPCYPTFSSAPLFVGCSRYVSGEGADKVFLTIYEIKDEASIAAALAVFERPDRQEYHRQWQAWEKKALTELDARLFTSI